MPQRLRIYNDPHTSPIHPLPRQHHPKSASLLRDRCPFIHGHIIRPPGTHAYLGLDYDRASGEPVTVLLDTGAGIIIVNETLRDILHHPTPGVPIHVVGDTLVTPLGGGTLPF